MRVLSDIVNHTLKNPMTGLWSRKNITGAIAFVYTIVYSTYGIVFDKTVHEFVVITFAGVAVSCLGISSWEKANIVRPSSNQAGDSKIQVDQLP